VAAACVIQPAKPAFAHANPEVFGGVGNGSSIMPPVRMPDTRD
jgi:hypothetical protein